MLCISPYNMATVHNETWDKSTKPCLWNAILIIIGLKFKLLLLFFFFNFKKNPVLIMFFFLLEGLGEIGQFEDSQG